MSAIGGRPDMPRRLAEVSVWPWTDVRSQQRLYRLWGISSRWPLARCQTWRLTVPSAWSSVFRFRRRPSRNIRLP